MGNSDRKRVDQNVAKIVGFSDFPIDMLRIDNCVPFTKNDSSKIIQSFENLSRWEIFVKKIDQEETWSIKDWKNNGVEILIMELVPN
jgi:hypothetical protein